ncbi:MAG TPA: EVE domain-containing protein [Candidatus Rifleibacterium sp.]|nr:EVE domain-containing protein [Candidatus Rifleibacterium sp.]HPT45646.1 EVE domain-containing protein [Candidatus Rifleibacterium sp.]
MQFWLMKSEPTVYSLADLERDGRTAWEGVRNYQARNFMRDSMQPGDLVLFYHSNAEPSGAAGIARVACRAYPDHAAFDEKSGYYDQRSSPEKPLWFMIDVEFVAHFASVIALETIKGDPALEGIMVARRGMRLSIQPLSEEHFRHICKLGGVAVG